MEEYYTHVTSRCISAETVYGYNGDDNDCEDDGYDLRVNEAVAEDSDHTHFSYLLTRRAIKVVETHNDPETPLFLYLPLQLVHSPRQVPQHYVDLYSEIPNITRRVYSGMVSMMDEAFGNITDALEKAGLMDNTLLIFTTDNGGPVEEAANNWPLRGSKETFWEGGTRGAAFVYSKTLLTKTGYVNNGMLHAVDWFPTILHLAGVQPDNKIDGVNQWDMLSNGGPSNRDEFVYNIDTIINSSAIRYKDYKLMTGDPGEFSGWYPLVDEKADDFHDDTELKVKIGWGRQLYNVRLDPEERNELSGTEPDMMQFMMNRLQKWLQSGVPPQNASSDPKGDPQNWGGVWTPGWC